jgi:hypothetical protein
MMVIYDDQSTLDSAVSGSWVSDRIAALVIRPFAVASRWTGMRMLHGHDDVSGRPGIVMGLKGTKVIKPCTSAERYSVLGTLNLGHGARTGAWVAILFCSISGLPVCVTPHEVGVVTC